MRHSGSKDLKIWLFVFLKDVIIEANDDMILLTEDLVILFLSVKVIEKDNLICR